MTDIWDPDILTVAGSGGGGPYPDRYTVKVLCPGAGPGVPLVSCIAGSVLSHLLLHGHLVVIADGVLPQEVKLHNVLLPVQPVVQRNVLDAQRTAAHGVSRLPFLFLIPSSQGQLRKDADTW